MAPVHLLSSSGRCIVGVDSCFFFQAEDGIRDIGVTGVQTCALPISRTVPRMMRTVRSSTTVKPRSRLVRRLCERDGFAVPPYESRERRRDSPGRSAASNTGRLALDLRECAPCDTGALGAEAPALLDRLIDANENAKGGGAVVPAESRAGHDPLVLVEPPVHEPLVRL